MTWPTFAEWQVSRGIKPWTLVHAERKLRDGIVRMGRDFGRSLLPAMQRMAAVMAAAAKSTAEWSTAMTGTRRP